MRLPSPTLLALLAAAGLLLLASAAGDVAPVITPVDAGLAFLARSAKVEGIVVHHSDTASAPDTQRVLAQRGYSTNYEVDQAGNVYCYGDPASQEAQASSAGFNAHTAAIDLTHYGSQEFAPAQVAAMQQLCRWLARRFGFGLRLAPADVTQEWVNWQGSGYTLFRHSNCHPTACPGGAPMELFV